jgi:O-acetyl-ADP-ribose deacetylase (regulator of RNase III)
MYRMRHLHLVSLNPEFTAAARTSFADLLGSSVTLEKCDVRDIPRSGHAFVSPANSLGFMDGGIDDVLRQMFPWAEAGVKALIRELGYTTRRGRPYLPVGTACSQMVGRDIALISAPTMFLPQDVSQTRNAYWAMMAVLVAADKLPEDIHTVVVPSLCCGWGRMLPAVAATQMREAYDDFCAGRVPAEVANAGRRYANLPTRDAEQPPWPENEEMGVRTQKHGPEEDDSDGDYKDVYL